MSGRFVGEYYTEEEFKEMVEKLNALMPRLSPWQWTHARKEHEDLFGEMVKPGDYYFKRKDGPAYGDVIKLSRLSMERLLVALFSGNFPLAQLAQENHEARLEWLARERAKSFLD